MDFLGPLIFLIAIVASIAQNLREKGKEQENREEMQRRIQEHKAKGESDSARTARPKGSARPTPTIAPGTSGKDLIEALFGEGSADSNEGWQEVPQEKPIRPAKRPDPMIPAATPRSTEDRVNQAAQARREEIERQRQARAQQAAQQRSRSQEQLNRQRQQAEREQQMQREQQARRQQQSRQQVMAERQRRKEEREMQRRQQAARAKQQRAPRRAHVPASADSFVPADLDDVRRAIVMAEILGPPKAMQD